ncbi:MAG TPA: helix-turn-helix transcriptional regulator [Pirellulales bacterium]|jgi:DNA-binding XRE family transcriptional regulator|nr:helix-turn-helix transcriptional regulator [Pirellulales bacterium]
MIGKQVTVQVAGKRLVILEHAEYERLCRLAGQAVADEDDLPALPEPDKHGHVPAIEFTRISIARDIIRERKALGLSQQALAELAGMRQETISRIESGKHTPTARTIDRIDHVLKQAARSKSKAAKKGK